MRIALYQPDIPQNTGTILRLGACLGVGVDVIGPAGFDMSDKALRRAGLDYLDHANLVSHLTWTHFEMQRQTVRPVPRLVLLTSTADTSYLDFRFQPDDILLFGRESSGVPVNIHTGADVRLKIPIRPGLRSLNLAVAAAMVVGEALRQTRQEPVSRSLE
jgi:tRNA (cytidine/uridine-2'-O-)-methyltransferase